VPDRTPVTVVSGFLGAGKTTLIRRILQEADGPSIAVLVNDFGALEIDAQLIGAVTDSVLSLKNGCICCSVRADLVAQVRQLLTDAPYDHVVVEASGLAEPGNIVRALGYPELRPLVYVSAVVTLVDCEAFADLDGQARYLAGEQLATADVVLLNKTDLARADQVAEIQSRWACPGLSFVSCRYADVPLDLIFVDRARGERAPAAGGAGGEGAAAAFESRVWRPPGPVDPARLRSAFAELPAGVIRGKGYVALTSTGSALVQSVGRRLNIEPSDLREGGGLVFVALGDSVAWEPWLEKLDRACSPSSG
jgi:G3E family GTPase